MNSQDETKLATAMGAKCINGVWHWKGSTWDSLIFRPLTDASDDYLVLKWMRTKKGVAWDQWAAFVDYLGYEHWNYEPGDYAKAAFRALRLHEVFPGTLEALNKLTDLTPKD